MTESRIKDTAAFVFEEMWHVARNGLPAALHAHELRRLVALEARNKPDEFVELK